MQEDRYSEAIGYYNEFVESHPDSKLKKEADGLKSDSEKGIVEAKRILADLAVQQEKYKELQNKATKPDSLKQNTIKTPLK